MARSRLVVTVAFAGALAGCGRLGFDPDRGPVASFPFEGSLRDEAGGHLATCSAGCPSFVPGHTGQGVRFDASSQCISLADDPAFRPPELTMALWVNLESIGDTVFAKSFDDIATANDSWELWFPDTGTVQFTTIEHNDNTYVTATDVAVGVWKHYAATLDGTTKRLYVDGIERASSAATGTAYDAGRVRIGCEKDTGTEQSLFVGVIDDVRFYDRALSAAEIAALAR